VDHGVPQMSAMEYVNMRDSRPWDVPAVIAVRDNHIVHVEPRGEEAGGRRPKASG